GRGKTRRMGRAQRNPSPDHCHATDDGFRCALPILHSCGLPPGSSSSATGADALRFTGIPDPCLTLMPSILLVEDETAIADTVLYALRAEGFEARHCLTGAEALQAAGEAVHDLAILDVGLPDIGGFALCRELRRDRDLPVIFLTARGADADRVLGLELGADDYVVKPFSPRELVARVRALLRRVHAAAERPASPLSTAGAFEHDAEGHRVRFHGH